MLAAVLFIGSIGAYALAVNPSFDTIIQPGSMMSSASVIVFRDATKTYFVLNGTTGAIETSGVSATTVLQYAITITPPNGLMFVRVGFYEIDAPGLLVQNAITIQGEGMDPTGRAGGTVLGCHGSAYGPILNVSTQAYWFPYFSLRSFTVVSCTAKDGIHLYSGAAGVLGYGHVEDVRVYSNGISGTPAGWYLRGVISSTFINVLSDTEYYGFRLSNSPTPAQSNFNKFIGGRAYNDQIGVYIDGQSSNNIIQGMDFGAADFGIYLSNANQTLISGNWFEATTDTVIFLLYPSSATEIFSNKIDVPSGVTGVWDNALRTRALANQFSGVGTKVAFGSNFLEGYYADNIFYNPRGQITSPIDATHATIGACATTCSATVSSWANYTVQGYDLYVNVASSSFNVYSPTGILIASNVVSYYVTFGYRVAFSGTPTIGVFGS